MGLLRTVFTKALARRILAGPRKRFVFLYHDISDPGSPQYSPLYSTQVQRFKAQVEMIAKHFHLVSLEEVVKEHPQENRRLASITFDDGFASVKDEAMPYLGLKGIPFSVFVNSMAVKHNRLFYGPDVPDINRSYDRKVFLDEADIKGLAAKGIDIGSHSSTHKVLAECDQATLKEEILENKLYIESLTNKAVKHFALPFGKKEHYDERVLEECRLAGHEFIYSTNPTFFESSSASYQRRLIPRIGLTNETPAEVIFMINRPLLKTIDI
ncbi:MAG TPA: polysaccharide deacetylase family protein [Pyrinomonadaceae bacterium]|nr:polysaccharide deacetylase family protein [Pyrinomonadaceae bacterium]